MGQVAGDAPPVLPCCARRARGRTEPRRSWTGCTPSSRRSRSPSSRSSQLMPPLLAATLVWCVTRAPPARSSGSRPSVRAKWPRWLVPNWSSKPSLVTWRSGGVMTPALLIRMSIGRPSAASVVDQRRHGVQRGQVERACRDLRARAPDCGCAARALSPFAAMRTGMMTSAPAAGEPGGDHQSDAVARARDDGELAGQVGNGDVESA